MLPGGCWLSMYPDPSDCCSLLNCCSSLSGPSFNLLNSLRMLSINLSCVVESTLSSCIVEVLLISFHMSSKYFSYCISSFTGICSLSLTSMFSLSDVVYGFWLALLLLLLRLPRFAVCIECCELSSNSRSIKSCTNFVVLSKNLGIWSVTSAVNIPIIFIPSLRCCSVFSAFIILIVVLVNAVDNGPFDSSLILRLILSSSSISLYRISSGSNNFSFSLDVMS